MVGHHDTPISSLVKKRERMLIFFFFLHSLFYPVYVLYILACLCLLDPSNSDAKFPTITVIFYNGYTSLSEFCFMCFAVVVCDVQEFIAVLIDVIICLFSLLNGLNPEFCLILILPFLLSVCIHLPGVIFHMPYFQTFFVVLF